MLTGHRRSPGLAHTPKAPELRSLGLTLPALGWTWVLARLLTATLHLYP